jgi:protein ImuB
MPACAVLDQECVGALTPAAQAAGLRLGMRRGGAAAIAPEVRLFERCMADEEEAKSGAALALLQYTPEVAAADEHTLLLDVSASLVFFGGPHALCGRIAATLARLNLHAIVGMAPTARGAWLLARQGRGRRRVASMRQMERLLDRLPLAALPQARDKEDWLTGIGCASLGQLRQLPRAGLQRRAGKALLAALDAAYGATPDLYAWITAPLQFTRRIELNERLEHSDAVLAVAIRLTEQMSGWLAARQLAVPSLLLSLAHERGRHARPPTLLALALAEPVWQSAHLAGLLREKLNRLILEAPVIAIELSASGTVPQPAASATLFPEPGGTPADHARLLDLLAARLGPENVRRPDALADHRPECANPWRNALLKSSHDGPWMARAPLDRPFWLLDPPLALQTRQHRPVHGTPLKLLRGPERIESGWWDGGLAVRDYFVAEDAQAARYWIFRERDQETAHWFLHGLYG